jgi:3-phenylpropionate/trans-cinnamate dioxygenase ferredoxin reductase component
MSDLHVKYLLLGGGVASFNAAQAIRQRDPQGSLMLIGQEISRPYDRSQISKGFLRRQIPRTALFTAEPDWFANSHVQLRTGTQAAHVDTTRRIVTLGSGQALTYDRLLVATGAQPRRLALPGADLPNVLMLRTIEDVERLHTVIDSARAGGRRHDGGRGKAAIIGGGLMGVEVAASLKQIGLAVDLVVGGPHPWSSFAGEATGKFVSVFLKSNGVTVHDGLRAAKVEGDNRAQRVILSDGKSLECDFVVACVGTLPNKELLRSTPIVSEKAILTDERCRTSEPVIFAAGDCAAIRDPIFGKHRWAEQWDTAAITGAIAGANMTGADETFKSVTTFVTEAFGVRLRAWGSSKHLDHRILRGAPTLESPDFLEIGVSSDGRVSQILAAGTASELPFLEELVRQRVQVAGQEEALKDPAVRLESLLK